MASRPTFASVEPRSAGAQSGAGARAPAGLLQLTEHKFLIGEMLVDAIDVALAALAKEIRTSRLTGTTP